MKGTEITCRELIDFLLDYLEDKLPGKQRRIFDAHLEICPSCVNYMESYRKTIRLGKQALGEPDDAPPDDVPEDLIQAILEARKGAK